MLPPQRSISLHEKSIAVNKLHKLLATLGYSVSKNETAAYEAGDDTLNKVRAWQQQSNITYDTSVLADAATLKEMQRQVNESNLFSEETFFTVSGTVFDVSGNPVKNQPLIALDIDLKGAAVYRTANSLAEITKNGGFEYLGEVSSNTTGYYSVRFSLDQFLKAERKRADIVVYAVDGDAIIGRTNRINAEMYAGTNEVRFVDVYLVNRDTRTEYEIIMQKLVPFLEESGVALEALTIKDQVAFTAQELDIKEEYINIAVQARILTIQFGQLGKTDPEKIHELLYGIGRRGTSLQLPVLYKKKKAELQQAIKDSVEAHIIRKTDEAVINELLELIHQKSAATILQYKGEQQPVTLQQLLSVVLKENSQQQVFVTAFTNFQNEHQNDTDYKKFWHEYLPQQPGFKDNPKLVDGLLHLQKLGIITGYHHPLIVELQVARGITSTEQLLELDSASWKDIISKTGVPEFVNGKDDEEKKQRYQLHIESLLHAAFPTQKINGMLKKGELPIENGDVLKGVTTFLGNTQQFDFSSSRIHDFEEEIKKAANGYHEEVKTELKKMQRVYQVSPTPGVMGVLINNNLDSAYSITNVPKSTFIKSYSNNLGGESIAEALYERASYIHTLAAERSMKVYEVSNGAAPKYAYGKSDANDVTAVLAKHIPNYAELFGSPDVCECEHCRSVYGPAAYFVDLLRYLWRGAKNADAKTPLDMFIKRRPDLLHLPLTCENSDTLIPYIDLVNEIMEYYTYHGLLDKNAAHDTGDTTADELRASPQYAEPEAYRILSNTVYPFSLPYHQPLDVIRTYSSHLKTERSEVMKAMQTSFTATTEHAIEAEQLQLSEQEYAVLTDKKFDGSNNTEQLHEYYGFTLAADLEKMAGTGVSDGIHEFLRRSGMKYTELVELVKTTFINPHQHLIDFIQKLFYNSALSSAALHAKLQQINAGTLIPSNDAAIMAALTPANITSAQFVTWVQQNFASLNKIITLYQSQSMCELDSTYLRTLQNIYAGVNTSGITTDSWKNIHRFIRLWRKIKWQIHETDLVLAALDEKEILPQTISKLANVLQLYKQIKTPVNQLAVFWGNIDTYREQSLYKKLFLNKAVQKIDTAFLPDKFGRYLTDATQLLGNHVPAMLAAFRMSEQDLQAILQVARVIDNNIPRKLDLNTDILNLANLSTIYRYVVFAKALKLKVTDLCTLVKLFEPAPFSFWNIQQSKYTGIAPDKTLAFFRIADSTKRSGFKAPVLDYIITGSLPAESSLGLKEEKVLQAARSIKQAFTSIEQGYPETPPPGLTSDQLKAILSLSFAANAVNNLIGITESRQTFSILTDTALPVIIPALLSAKYAYDPVSGILLARGIMTEADTNSLKALAGATDNFKAAADNLFVLSKTIPAGSVVYEVFTDTNLPVVITESLSPKFAYIKASGRLTVTGVMSAAERTELKNLAGVNANFNSAVDELYAMPEAFLAENFSGIFTNLPAANSKLLNHPAQPVESTLTEKLEWVYLQYIPVLKKKLRQDAITQYLSALLGITEDITSVLMKAEVPGLVDSLAKAGFSATYYSDAGWNTAVLNRLDAAVDFDWGNVSPDADQLVPVVPANNFSARWQTYLSPPSSGEYTLQINVKEQDELFRLYLDDALILEKNAANTNTSLEVLAQLNASQLHRVRVEYAEINANAGISLSWKNPISAMKVVNGQTAFPFTEINAFINIVKIYHRAAKFITGFKLTAAEVDHFIAFKANFENFDFKVLTGNRWLRINDYVELRNAVPQQLATLTDLFAAANVTNPVPTLLSLNEKLALASGWDTATINYLTTYFSLGVNNYKNEKALKKIQEVINYAHKTGISAEAIAIWAAPETDFDNLYAMAQTVKATVKAKYEEEEWLEISGQLSDTVREHQKQALISHLLTKPELMAWGAKDADGLFEYFLIDVQMGACMETSRIVQASAAVQQFVNRCVLNLESKATSGQEKGVSPEALDKDRWQWMEYYRVWEVNRKIFLYPENWLEPEWRDDRSPFFKELESELIQNDISARSVEAAFRNYLNKLNTVANIDVCASLPEKDPNGNLKLFHVFGRSHNVPYQYHYRTCDKYKKWSAWDKIPVDIRSVEKGDSSGVHLIPVLWKQRLFLFWPEFMEKQENNPVKNDQGNEASFEEMGKKAPTTAQPLKYWEVRLGWTEFVDGKWTPKQLSKEFIKQEYWSYIPDESDIRFATEIDSDEVLTIYLVINFGNIDKQPRDWYLDGAFELADITAKINAISGSYGHAHEKLDPDYITTFMGVTAYSDLELKNKLCLKTNVRHKLILSPDSRDFDPTFKDPFFYSDNLRTYFVRPVDIWVKEIIKNTDRYTPGLMDIVDDSYWTTAHLPGPEVERKLETEIEIHSHPGGYGMAAAQPGTAIRNASNGLAPAMAARSAINTNGVMGVQAMATNANNQVSMYDAAFAGTEQLVNYNFWLKKETGYEFHTFYHPYSTHYISRLNQQGLDGLMASDTLLPADSGTVFESNYVPQFTAVIKAPASNAYKPGEAYTYYKENVCFDVFGANSIYNWELFYHSPLYIATRLSKNGKYQEAMKWFHYIFDPTTNELPGPGQSDTSRYWKVLPFKTTPAENLEEWFMNLGANNNPATENAVIGEWRDHPFKPFIIARNRPLAFMKNVVLKYVENLVNWADSLFRAFTRESVYEALQIYVMANHILGPRPEFVPVRGKIKAETYDSLKNKWDDFSNALVEMENLFPYSSSVPAGAPASGNSLLGIGKALYFCIPNNEKLLGYWDTVADRLYKIRHCMDIDGIERQLALFAPPIDPALLINAAAKGLSLGSILSDLSSPPPIYRFSYLIQRANEFCNEVKSLGASLLSALEKKDAEEFARLRASNETTMLELMTAIKERQVLDAKANRDVILKSRASAAYRLEHFNALLTDEGLTIPAPPTLDAALTADSMLPDTTISELKVDADAGLVDSGDTGIKIIPKEKEDIDKSLAAKWLISGAGLAEAIAGVMHMFPQLDAEGTPLGVGVGAWWGGQNLGAGTSALAKAAQAAGTFLSMESASAARMAQYIRREQDWTLQANIAAKEIIQLDKQLVSAEIKIQIAEKELTNHKTQIEQSKQTEQFLADKFTNQELYQWMKEQLFAVYKQSYNMAYDMARKVEKCYGYELGTEITNFIQYGYWDNAQQGLFAGEKLQLALRQMEKSYLEENKRELELTKNVSVALLNPLALQELRTTGKCFVTIPEELFDMDYPGHYFRRIKSVKISLPCIAGPFTTINCSLRLLKNTVRINTTMNDDGNYEHNNDEGILIEDDRFRDNNVPVKAIATSTAQQDAGLFELNFKDERYLPFEGAGAISQWKIELNADPELRQFDYNTISDVVIHVSYTAREDAGLFRQQAISHVKDFLSNAAELSTQPLMRMFNMKHEFSSEWHKFLHPVIAGADQTLAITLRREHFPFFTQNKTINVKKMTMLLSANRTGDYRMLATGVNLDGDPMNSDENGINMPESPLLGNMQKATLTATTTDFNVEELNVLAPLSFRFQHNSDSDWKSVDTDPEEITDIIVVVHYSLGDQ